MIRPALHGSSGEDGALLELLDFTVAGVDIDHTTVAAALVVEVVPLVVDRGALLLGLLLLVLRQRSAAGVDAQHRDDFPDGVLVLVIELGRPVLAAVLVCKESGHDFVRGLRATFFAVSALFPATEHLDGSRKLGGRRGTTEKETRFTRGLVVDDHLDRVSHDLLGFGERTNDG